MYLCRLAIAIFAAATLLAGGAAAHETATAYTAARVVGQLTDLYVRLTAAAVR